MRTKAATFYTALLVLLLSWPLLACGGSHPDARLSASTTTGGGAHGGSASGDGVGASGVVTGSSSGSMAGGAGGDDDAAASAGDGLGAASGGQLDDGAGGGQPQTNLSVPDAAELPADAASDDARPQPNNEAGPTAADDANSNSNSNNHSSFCALQVPKPRFCDDFDQTPLPGGWNGFDQVGGALRLDATSFVSPPNSLLGRFAAGIAGVLNAALRARFALPAPPTTITLQFQVQPTVADPTDQAVLAFASLDFFDAANNRYSPEFTLFRNNGAIRVQFGEQSLVGGGTKYLAHDIPDPLPSGKWTHVRLVIARSAVTTASARLFFGDDPASTLEVDTPLTMSVKATTLQLTIGSSFETQPSQGWEIRYDNVVLDF
jgi:hypothetical protein